VRILVAAVACCAAVPTALAFGGHEKLGCAGCHAIHAGRGAALAAVAPVQRIDPLTGALHGPLTAMCLACHADAKDGGRGIAPVSQHMQHPFSRERPDPRIARVPPELLRGERFECVSCHDPHPSNPNYRYLRLAARGSPSVSELCSICHARKAGASDPPRLYSSMDEREPLPSAPAAAP
jgi:predicted CXXCH cytochrome family protein